MNYSDNQYFDAPDVTVSTENFGSVLSFANFSELFVSSGDPNTLMINYFIERGYTMDVNLRAAPYDWRLGAGMTQKGIHYSLLSS